MPTRAHITIREVAARAGVSHQTVSRVINNSERVNAETRAKVETAIRELGYIPNANARIMARGITATLACISPNLTDFTLASIIEGAQSEARKQGYLLIAAAAPDTDTFQILIAELVSSRRAEGLIVINPYADERYTLLSGGGPIVFAGARPRNENVCSVSLDDESVGKMATQHLLDLGHRAIAMITGPLAEDCTADRSAGYGTAMQAAHQAVDDQLICIGDWSATSGYQAVRSLLQTGAHFSAIFAQNDRMAVGAIRALREANLRVPEDVSVIGVDDMPLSSYFSPALTTIRQDILSIGRQTARTLIEMIQNPHLGGCHHRLPAELVVRESTAVFRG